MDPLRGCCVILPRCPLATRSTHAALPTRDDEHATHRSTANRIRDAHTTRDTQLGRCNRRLARAVSIFIPTARLRRSAAHRPTRHHSRRHRDTPAVLDGVGLELALPWFAVLLPLSAVVCPSLRIRLWFEFSLSDSSARPTTLHSLIHSQRTIDRRLSCPLSVPRMPVPRRNSQLTFR